MSKDLLDDQYGRFFELPLELARFGHRVAGFCLSYRQRSEGHLLGPDIDGTMVDWYSVNLGWSIVPGLIRYLKRLNAICSEFRPDIIYACSDAPHVIHGCRVARKLDIPCVVDLYDNFESFKMTKLPGLLPLFKRSVSSADGVVCVSSNLQKYVEKHYHPKGLTKIIPNGIPAKLFHPMDRRKCRKKLGLPENAKLIGTAGALSTSRGIDMLFDGYKELATGDPSIHLALAGPIASGIILPEGDKIHYFGNLDYQDVPILLNALDVGVICNIDSSFGRYCFPQKAYEMFACEIPVVAAKVGVMADIFEDYSGFLFYSGDYRSFVLAVKKQLEEPESVQLVVPTWQDLATRLESFFKRCCYLAV